MRLGCVGREELRRRVHQSILRRIGHAKQRLQSHRMIGSSPRSWEEAAKNAVEQASKHLKELRVAEVDELDKKIEAGKVTAYRAKVHISFRYEGGA